ncbi:MAG TPA: aldehyde dehydrogenase family protein, partial [Kofleriaceae bacterium]|nr:aldehyde dehydrogenase family protein [Kofleriaceae bacterium]
MKTINHWIDGKPSERTPERTGDVFNPATGEVQANVAFASPAQVDEAVESAWHAAQSWREASIAKRTKIMFAFRQLVDKHQSELAKLLTLEHGKVTADAMGEVARGLEVIEFACGIA